MKPAFKHFLLTRINLGYVERISGGDLNEKEWLNYRFDIFYKTCFLSVIRQSIQDFTWLIYLDARTPDYIVSRLTKEISQYNNIMIFFREGGFDSLANHARKDIRSLIDDYCCHIITSRVDSDDLIHRDFIREVQCQFQFQDYMSINFTYGWVHDFGLGLIGKAKNRSNPFISLIEKSGNGSEILTVCWQSHSDFLFEMNRLEITKRKRLWCMNIHAVNDSTKFHGLPIFYLPDQLVDDFGFPFFNKARLSQKLYFTFRYFWKQSKKIPSFIFRFLKS